MAIRSGSGGLKYPLPSQGQIQAQQSAAAASAGGSAAASGYSANRRYAGLKMQLGADAYQSAVDRQFRAQQAYFGREHDKGAQLEAQKSAAERQAVGIAAAKESQWQGYYLGQEQARQDRDFITARDQKDRDFTREQNEIQEREIDTQFDVGIGEGTLVLSETAQRELAAIEEGRVEAQKLDPQGQAEYEEQAQQRERALKRTAKPPKGPDTTGQANQGLTHFDPQTGGFTNQPIQGRTTPGFYDSEKRTFTRIELQQDESKEDQAKQDVKRAQELLRETDLATGKPFTPEAARKRVIEENAEFGQGFDPPPEAPLGMGHSVQQRSGSDIIPQPPLGMGHSVQSRSGSGATPGAPGTGGGAYPVASEQNAMDHPEQLPSPTTAGEYAAIPQGAMYRDRSGNLMRKK